MAGKDKTPMSDDLFKCSSGKSDYTCRTAGTMEKKSLTTGLLIGIIALGGITGILLWAMYGVQQPRSITGPAGRDGQGISYVFSNNGSGVYVAYPGRNGLANYSGTNASYVLQCALNATNADGGGIIQVQAGTYYFDYGIRVYNHTTLQGEGDSTKFIAQSSSNLSYLIWTENDAVIGAEIKNLMIDNKLGTPIVTAIDIDSIGECVVEDVTIIGDFANETIMNGIIVLGTDITITKCSLVDVSQYGIMGGLATSLNVVNCEIIATTGGAHFPTTGILVVMTMTAQVDSCYISGLSGCGIEMGMTVDCQISSNHIYECGNDTTGIEKAAVLVEGCGNVHFHDNYVENSRYDGLSLEDVSDSTFSGNTYYDNDWDGIYLIGDCLNNIFDGEQTNLNTLDGIYENGGASGNDYNMFSNCMCQDDLESHAVNSRVYHCLDNGVWV